MDAEVASASVAVAALNLSSSSSSSSAILSRLSSSDASSLAESCKVLFSWGDSVDPEQFLHTVADELSGRQPSSSSSRWSAFSAQKSADPVAFSSVIQTYKIIARQTVALSLPKEQVVADLESFGLAKEQAEVVQRWIFIRKEEIRRFLAAQTTSLLSEYHLADFDWKLHLVLSSDKVSVLRRPVLLLTLFIGSGNDPSTRQELTVELGKDELAKLLSTFGSIHEVVQSLKF